MGGQRGSVRCALNRLIVFSRVTLLGRVEFEFSPVQTLSLSSIEETPRRAGKVSNFVPVNNV